MAVLRLWLSEYIQRFLELLLSDLRYHSLNDPIIVFP